MHFILKILFPISLICVFLTGCVTSIIGTGIVGGYALFRDKNIGDSITDSKIDILIKTKLSKIDKELCSNVSVVTNNGCVLFTGRVSHPEDSDLVEKTAWSVAGVCIVDNNIIIGKKLSKKQIMQDGKITLKCRAILLCSQSVKSVNYKIKTMLNIVYISGIARNEEELQIVIANIKKIKKVKKVVVDVKIKN